MGKVITTCKTCRRLGVSVCGREKCAIKRKPYPPGIHGISSARRGSRRLSEFGQQLKEKQIIRFSYGLREKQFRNYVKKASETKDSNTPEKLIELLESRLDNTVYRMGFASSRSSARQIVGHGHITVNGRKVNLPSYQTKKGDKIKIRSQSSDAGMFKNLDFSLKKYNPPSWLKVDESKKEAEISGRPVVDESGISADSINSIIEFYSR